MRPRIRYEIIQFLSNYTSRTYIQCQNMTEKELEIALKEFNGMMEDNEVGELLGN